MHYESYCYDGDHVLTEYDHQGNLARKYIYGLGVDQPICMTEVADNNAVYYYHADGLGSIVALSDASGDTVQTYDYTTYGQVAASDVNHTNPYMFTGRRFDIETGLYYYRARMYDAHLGRFLQTDPTGYDDGINWYAYCGNNPVNATDPSGLYIIDYNGVPRNMRRKIHGKIISTYHAVNLQYLRTKAHRLKLLSEGHDPCCPLVLLCEQLERYLDNISKALISDKKTLVVAYSDPLDQPIVSFFAQNKQLDPDKVRALQQGANGIWFNEREGVPLVRTIVHELHHIENNGRDPHLIEFAGDLPAFNAVTTLGFIDPYELERLFIFEGQKGGGSKLKVRITDHPLYKEADKECLKDEGGKCVK